MPTAGCKEDQSKIRITGVGWRERPLEWIQGLEITGGDLNRHRECGFGVLLLRRGEIRQ